MIGKTILQPPVTIPVTTAQGVLSPEWRQFFAGLNYFLQKFQVSIQVPTITTAQRDNLNVANGWIIYNNDTNSFQGYVDGAWKTFNLT